MLTLAGTPLQQTPLNPGLKEFGGGQSLFLFHPAPKFPTLSTPVPLSLALPNRHYLELSAAAINTFFIAWFSLDAADCCILRFM